MSAIILPNFDRCKLQLFLPCSISYFGIVDIMIVMYKNKLDTCFEAQFIVLQCNQGVANVLEDQTGALILRNYPETDFTQL